MTIKQSGVYTKSPEEATLKLHGIEWAYFSVHGHIALGYLKHAICYDPSDKKYHLKESGKSVFSDSDVTKCLDKAPEIIFDYYADQITKPLFLIG